MFGASDGEIFRRITFPQLVPTIAFLLTVNLIGAFKVYTQVYALFGGRAGIANSATTAVYYIYDKFHIAGRNCDGRHSDFICDYFSGHFLTK